MAVMHADNILCVWLRVEQGDVIFADFYSSAQCLHDINLVCT